MPVLGTGLFLALPFFERPQNLSLDRHLGSLQSCRYCKNGAVVNLATATGLGVPTKP